MNCDPTTNQGVFEARDIFHTALIHDDAVVDRGTRDGASCADAGEGADPSVSDRGVRTDNDGTTKNRSCDFRTLADADAANDFALCVDLALDIVGEPVIQYGVIG